MAATHKLYANAPLNALAGKINFLSDTIKAMLVDSGYTFDQANHAFKSDVSGEVTGTGYSAGGVALASKTLTVAALVTKLSSATITFSGVTLTAATGCILYDSTPSTDATRPLISFIDFGGAQSPTATDLNITISGGGEATVTVS